MIDIIRKEIERYIRGSEDSANQVGLTTNSSQQDYLLALLETKRGLDGFEEWLSGFEKEILRRLESRSPISYRVKPHEINNHIKRLANIWSRFFLQNQECAPKGVFIERPQPLNSIVLLHFLHLTMTQKPYVYQHVAVVPKKMIKKYQFDKTIPDRVDHWSGQVKDLPMVEYDLDNREDVERFYSRLRTYEHAIEELRVLAIEIIGNRFELRRIFN